MKIFKYLSRKLRVWCVAVILVAIFNACIASIWPVLLSRIYDDISNGVIYNRKKQDRLFKLS